jgi:multiple sugar transport system substrate-binding protein
MRRQAIALTAAALILAPLGAKAADLVVWWEKAFYPQSDAAVAEVIAAFEQKTGKQVDLVQPTQAEILTKARAALEAGQPPDFLFSTVSERWVPRWAYEDQLAELQGDLGHVLDLFDPDAIEVSTLLDGKTGRRALYALPMGRVSNHVHVWNSLLERSGFTLADVPGQWEAFWSFWCDRVQPAVRKALGRDDIWGIGRPMSVEAGDTTFQFFQFIYAYDADYVTRDGKLVIDDPEIRRRLIKAIDSYTAVYREGCTPPDSVNWDDRGNNRAFLDQTVAMTTNNSLSIPNALKHERPKDYYENSATIEWPVGSDGKAFPIQSVFFAGVVFRDGRNVAAAKEFVRFLVAEGWLAHYLDFAGERMLPPMPKLLDAPFWLDPSDPHRMAAVMQIASRPTQYDYAVVSGDWRYDLVWSKSRVWATAIHRVAAEGVSPEQAVDEAIARIKQILAE